MTLRYKTTANFLEHESMFALYMSSFSSFLAKYYVHNLDLVSDTLRTLPY